MAGISSGGGSGGKKSVDSEIPLVPFIDLLLCCVMFLLVTAVWNQLAALDVTQQQPGAAAPEDAPPPEEKVQLILQVKKEGYVLSSTAGDKIEIPLRKVTEEEVKEAAENQEKTKIVGELVYDQEGLTEQIQERRKLEPDREDLIIAPQDGVFYQAVVEAMDVVIGEGFKSLSLSDGTYMDEAPEGADAG